MSSSPWHGWVPAGGFVFDEALIGREVLVTRLLTTWTAEARLGRAGTRWYLVGVTPRRVDSRAAIGAPLVSFEGRWLAGPVADDVVRRAPRDSVLEYRGGELCVTALASLTPAHPCELVDLEVPEVLEPEVLEPPPGRVVTSAQRPTVETLFAPMLEAHEARRGATSPEPQVAHRARVGDLLRGLGRRLASLAQAVGRIRLPPPRLRPRRGEDLDVRRIRSAAPPRPGPSWLRRLTSWLGSSRPPAPPRDPPSPVLARRPGWLAMAYAFLRSRRGSAAQQEYLEDLRRRFSAGDLGEALRWAIPLATEGWRG